MAHALLSPSSGDRWLNCTPSAKASEHIVQTTSIHAEIGSLAHAIGELHLRYYLENLEEDAYQDELARLKSDPLYKDDFDEPIDDYVTFVREVVAQDERNEVGIEQRLDLTNWAPRSFGTGDCVVVNPDEIHIIDLKFGEGVVVSAVDNTQLKLYALGALDSWSFIYENIKTVKLTIAMVRRGNIETFELPVEELLEWGETFVRPNAKLAFKGEGERKAGTWCRWCPVRAVCRERASTVLDGINPVSDNLDLYEVQTLLPQLGMLEDWIRDVRSYALGQALGGVEIKGYKLVESQTKRSVVNQAELIERLYKKGYAKRDLTRQDEIVTLGKLEKLVGKDKLTEIAGDLIIRPKGTPALVPESDKREAISLIENEFNFE